MWMNTHEETNSRFLQFCETRLKLMTILSTAKISVPILVARVKGSSDFKPDWCQLAETE